MPRPLRPWTRPHPPFVLRRRQSWHPPGKWRGLMRTHAAPVRGRRRVCRTGTIRRPGAALSLLYALVCFEISSFLFYLEFHWVIGWFPCVLGIILSLSQKSEFLFPSFSFRNFSSPRKSILLSFPFLWRLCEILSSLCLTGSNSSFFFSIVTFWSWVPGKLWLACFPTPKRPLCPFAALFFPFVHSYHVCWMDRPHVSLPQWFSDFISIYLCKGRTILIFELSFIFRHSDRLPRLIRTL